MFIYEKATVVDILEFAKKAALCSLKTNFDKLNIDEFNNNRLRNVMNNDAVKKTVYDKLITKINTIDTSGLFPYIQYNSDKQNLKKEIENVSKN